MKSLTLLKEAKMLQTSKLILIGATLAVLATTASANVGYAGGYGDPTGTCEEVAVHDPITDTVKTIGRCGSVAHTETLPLERYLYTRCFSITGDYVGQEDYICEENVD